MVSEMATNDLTAVMLGIISGTPIPQPLPDPNACDSGVKCPIKAGAENLFRQVIYIEPDFPEVNLSYKDLTKKNSPLKLLYIAGLVTVILAKFICFFLQPF